MRPWLAIAAPVVGAAAIAGAAAFFIVRRRKAAAPPPAPARAETPGQLAARVKADAKAKAAEGKAKAAAEAEAAAELLQTAADEKAKSDAAHKARGETKIAISTIVKPTKIKTIWPGDPIPAGYKKSVWGAPRYAADPKINDAERAKLLATIAAFLVARNELERRGYWEAWYEKAARWLMISEILSLGKDVLNLDLGSAIGDAFSTIYAPVANGLKEKDDGDLHDEFKSLWGRANWYIKQSSSESYYGVKYANEKEVGGPGALNLREVEFYDLVSKQIIDLRR